MAPAPAHARQPHVSRNLSVRSQSIFSLIPQFGEVKSFPINGVPKCQQQRQTLAIPSTKCKFTFSGAINNPVIFVTKAIRCTLLAGRETKLKYRVTLMPQDKEIVTQWSESAPYWEKHREIIREMFAPVT